MKTKYFLIMVTFKFLQLFSIRFFAFSTKNSTFAAKI